MTGPLKVLHVQHSLHPGGMENGVVNVARRLHSRGFEFHVVCLSSSGAFADRLPDPSLVHVLNKSEGFSISTIAALRRRIRSTRPDVLHTHNLGALIYTALARRFDRRPPILHGEHATPESGPGSRRQQFQRRIFFRAANKVHTVSQDLCQHFVDDGFPSSRLTALINGVDTERYSPGDRHEARETLRLPQHAPVLLIVGRLISSKRHLLLFQAFEKIARSRPDAILLAVGDRGDARDKVYEAARTSPVCKQIRMEGFQEDLLPYYRAADLLVAPSEVEGLSNAVLEAMACELCPVLEAACGNAEIVQDGSNGVVRRIESASGLADTIHELLADPARRRAMGRNARERVEQAFSLEAMCNAYEDIYRQMVRDTGG